MKYVNPSLLGIITPIACGPVTHTSCCTPHEQMSYNNTITHPTYICVYMCWPSLELIPSFGVFISLHTHTHKRAYRHMYVYHVSACLVACILVVSTFLRLPRAHVCACVASPSAVAETHCPFVFSEMHIIYGHLVFHGKIICRIYRLGKYLVHGRPICACVCMYVCSVSVWNGIWQERSHTDTHTLNMDTLIWGNVVRLFVDILHCKY